MIDSHGLLGTVGAVGAWGLADYHLIAATTAAVITSVYMILMLVKKVRDREDD
jgi:hypothetical protein